MASQDIIDAIRQELGLNEPLWYSSGSTSPG